MRPLLIAGATLVLVSTGMPAMARAPHGDVLRAVAMRAAQEMGILPALLVAIGEQESEHRLAPPRRPGDGTGPMQIKDGTWRQMGCTGARGIAFDEYRCGARYLRWQIDRYGDMCLAVQAYHDGSAERPCGAKGSYAQQVLLRAQYIEMSAAVRNNAKLQLAMREGG